MTVKKEISDGDEYERGEDSSVSSSVSSNLCIDDSSVAETMTKETKPVSDDDSYQNRSRAANNESRKSPTATKKGKKVKSKQVVTSDEEGTRRKRKYKKRKLKPNPDVEISEDGRTFKCAFCHREWRNKGISFALVV